MWRCGFGMGIAIPPAKYWDRDMSDIKELNLVGVIEPICLLKCQNELAKLNSGDRLDVLIQDPVVIEDLKKILGPSPNEIITVSQEKDCFRVRIRKGRF